jgi:hypothetical protein
MAMPTWVTGGPPLSAGLDGTVVGVNRSLGLGVGESLGLGSGLSLGEGEGEGEGDADDVGFGFADGVAGWLAWVGGATEVTVTWPFIWSLWM